MPLFNKCSAIFQTASKRFPILASFITISLIAASSIYFRVHLALHIAGDTFIGSDSYRHARNVRQIVSDGALPEIDLMRHVPDGVKTTLETISFPWVVAKSYGLLNHFLPELSLNKTMALYPVVVFVPSCFVFFLLTNKHFGYLTASLATLAFSIAPGVINRTTAGYLDTDSLVLFLFLLAFFFYTLSLDSLSTARQVIYRLIYAGILGIIAIMWGGVGLIAAIIYGCDILIGIYRGFDRKHAISSLLGVCLYFVLLFLPGSFYQERFPGPFALSAMIPPAFAGLIYVAVLIKQSKLQPISYFSRIFSRKGLIGIGLLLIYPVYRMWGTITSICERLLFPFGTDPIMGVVGELDSVDFNDWIYYYGLLYPIGLIGFFLLISVFHLRKGSCRNSWFHLFSLSFGFLSIILTRMFTSFFLNQPLWIGVIVLLAPICGLAFYISWLFIKNSAERVLPFLIWFLVSFSFSSSAVRFTLFFTPIFVLMSSFCFVKMIEYFIPDLSRNIGATSLFVLNIVVWLMFACGFNIFTIIQVVFGIAFDTSVEIRLLTTLALSLISLGFVVEKSMIHIEFQTAMKRFCGFLTVCLLCFFSYTGVYGLGIGQIGYTSAKFPVNQTEEFVRQIEQNTPSNAVVAAYWDYGSIINAIGQRATIIDEQQNLDWIRSFLRQVILGQTAEEMLSYLKAHRATHLMLTAVDLRNLNGYWRVAYPDQFRLFVIDLEPTEKAPNVLRFEFVPLTKSVPVIHKDSLMPEPTNISKITVDFTNQEDTFTLVAPPQVLIGKRDSLKKVQLREFIMGKRQWYFPEAELPLTLWLMASEKAREIEVYDGFLLTQSAQELNVVKLYSGALTDELSEHFEEIITEENYGAKVWTIHY